MDKVIVWDGHGGLSLVQVGRGPFILFLCPSLAERGGIKRRHNMLYGVTAEEALLSGMLPLGTPSRQQRKKTTQEGKEGERKGKAEEGQR